MHPRRPWTAAAGVAAVLLGQGACPATVAPQAQLDFACVDDRDCVRPSVCHHNVCISPTELDAGIAELGGQERGPDDRQATDSRADAGAPQDGSLADRHVDTAAAPDATDASHQDSAGPHDSVGDAGPDLDGASAGDLNVQDQGAADAGTATDQGPQPDAAVVMDAAVVDLATAPDEGLAQVDGTGDASAAPDSAVEDRAAPADTQPAPDTTAPDTALPDTVEPDTVGPDTAKPSCDDLYRGITAYMLCAETATSCSVFARMSQSCASICEAYAGSCLGAYADSNDTCASIGDATCDAVMGDGVCTCSRP